MILIQIAAAALLLLGSALILHALVSLEAPSRPRRRMLPLPPTSEAADEPSVERLRRAA